MKCSKGLAAVLLVVLGVLALAGSQEQHCGSAPREFMYMSCSPLAS